MPDQTEHVLQHTSPSRRKTTEPSYSKWAQVTVDVVCALGRSHVISFLLTVYVIVIHIAMTASCPMTTTDNPTYDNKNKHQGPTILQPNPVSRCLQGRECQGQTRTMGWGG